MRYQDFFSGKSILITGGTGSFGQTMARTLLSECSCRKVIIFSRDEWKQWEMRRSDPLFNSDKIRYFIGDVRDLQRLRRAFDDVDYVVHTAALKQVPAAEYNPSEFIKTNVLGAMNIVEASINSNVKKVIALSTDKACNPVNLYGATKLCADKLFVNGNVYVGAKGHPTFSVVRYGNVIGSRGSIVPMWRQQVKEGAKEIVVTDERMTRFWITLRDAVHFVLKCFSWAEGGEIFVPKIPSMKIVDLAHAIGPGLPIRFSGIREGEKLHEYLICVEDARHSVEFDDRYVIIPETYSSSSPAILARLNALGGAKLPEGFAYCSESNNRWLSASDLQKILD